MKEFRYHYTADVVSVYDGDTIRVNIHLGFGLNWKGEKSKGVSIRLYGIDTPEVRGEERPQGLIARDRVRELILGKTVTIKTIMDSTGKYGRYLGIVVMEDGTNLNDLLVSEGLAEVNFY
jgi:micrococcal nuclease